MSLNRQQKIELIQIMEEKAYRLRHNRWAAWFPDKGKYRRELYKKHVEFFRNTNADPDDVTECAFIAANRVGKCVKYDTLIDMPNGVKRTIGSLYEEGRPFNVMAYNGKNKVVARASTPFSKGEHNCYRISFSDGTHLEAADHHRILLENGNYVFLEDLAKTQTRKGSGDVLRSSAHEKLDVAYCLQTAPDSMGYCSIYTRQYGVLLRQKLGNALRFARQQSDAHHSSHPYQKKGALAFAAWCILYAECGLLSMPGYFLHNLIRFAAPFSVFLYRIFGKLSLSLPGLHRLFRQPDAVVADQPQSVFGLNQHHILGSVFFLKQARFWSKSWLYKTCSSLLQRLFHCEFSFLRPFSLLSCTCSSPLLLSGKQIVAIKYIGRNEVFDFEVEHFHNYIAGGLVHHNTVAGAYCVKCWTTGVYPDWWEGRVFNRPTNGWCAGDTSETVRDIIQLELLGQPGQFGTGMIPADSIIRTTPKTGIPDAVKDIHVRYTPTDGISHIGMKSYDQKRKSFQGTGKDWIWNDEESDIKVYTEEIMRLMTTKGVFINTFTPLSGLSEVVLSFLPGGKLPK